MGRPKASPRILEFAVLFADAVTTDSPNYLVARTGKYSIFALLSQVAPDVSRHSITYCYEIIQVPCFTGCSKRGCTEITKVIDLLNVLLNKFL